MKEKIITESFISRIEAMTLYLQSSMRGYFGGNHRTKTHGQTVEFADFREYVLGDDIRYIDWNLYSRFEKHFIRLFVDERQMHMQIYLDCSASMERVSREKGLFALRSMAAMGYMSAHAMDRTSFLFMKGDHTDNACTKMSGKSSFFRNLRYLEEIEFKGETDIEKAIISCPDNGYNDGLTVIISDFMTDSNWKKAVDYLRFRKRQVMLIHVMSPEELDPFRYNGRMFLRDVEAGSDFLDGRHMKLKITKAHIKAYYKALEEFTTDIKSFCSARGMYYIKADAGQPVDKLLFTKLLQAGIIK
jgi:uncharacterized protein (DUF58 family)